MALDFSPLTMAVARLQEGLVRYDLDHSDAQIRDGLIQRFELTYDPAHKMLRRAILRRHLPATARVRVFGSRAGGDPKPRSDLDLAIEAPESLPLPLMAELAEAFAESRLRWKVDIVDRRTVSEAFGRIIDASARTL